jgi:hypothetical protein
VKNHDLAVFENLNIKGQIQPLKREAPCVNRGRMSHKTRTPYINATGFYGFSGKNIAIPSVYQHICAYRRGGAVIKFIKNNWYTPMKNLYLTIFYASFVY